MTAAVGEPRVDVTAEFREHLRAAGIETTDEIVADDRVRRLRANGEARSSVTYRLRRDGDHAIGWACDHKSSETISFRSAASPRPTTANERRALAAQIEERRQQEDQERTRRYEKMACRAAEILSHCADEPIHPYLEAKGLQQAAKVFRGDLRIGGQTCKGAMVAPLRDIDGRLWSLQFVLADGTKLLLPSARKHGCFARIGFPKNGSVPARILVTEGIATAYSVAACASPEDAVAIAFDASNLLPVARAIRERFPGTPIIVCADDDAYLWARLNKLLAEKYGVRAPIGPSDGEATVPGSSGPVVIRTAIELDDDGVQSLAYTIEAGSNVSRGIMLNAGRTKANQAAREIGNAWVCFPAFRAREVPIVEPPNKATDFNDLHLLDGIEAVRACIEAAQQPVACVSEPVQSTASSVCADVAAHDPNAWPEPEPLVADCGSAPYPTAALPPVLRDAVEEVLGFTQAPAALAACSALSALSVAAQGLVNVRRDSALAGPVSLYSLVIADSGERKSTCDSIFAKPLRDFELNEQARLAPDIVRARAAYEAWSAKRDGIREQIKQAAKRGKSTVETEAALERLAEDEPSLVIAPRLIFGDVTPEQLGFSLATGWPSAGILSAEGGTVLGSHGMGADALLRNLAVLNALWGGEDLHVDRRTSASYTLRARRLSFGLMVQPAALAGFLDRAGTLARGTGFLPRFLVAWPDSTQGRRRYREAPARMPAVDRYAARIQALLREPLPLDERGGLAPTVLALDGRATAAWAAFHDEIERELGDAGELRNLRDFGSRAAEHASRVAALLHVVEHGIGGAISSTTMERACALVDWHMGQARRLIERLDLPPALASALRLDAWLVAESRRTDGAPIPRSRAMQFGPLRDKTALDAALDELAQRCRVRQSKEGRQIFLEINPALVMGGER